MNSNMFHNLANWAIVILSAATAALIATGCTQTAAGVMECSKSFIDIKYTTFAVMALGVLKSLINVVRDGFGGLFAAQPPVEKK